MNDLQLRPAQEKILEYENGRLAISAVPGSGKTFTLSLLATKLIGDGRIDLNLKLKGKRLETYSILCPLI